MRYINQSTNRAIELPQTDRYGVARRIKPGESFDGPSSTANYNFDGDLVRGYAPYPVSSYTVADPLIARLSNLPIVNGYTVAQGDVDEFSGLTLAVGERYTLIGTIEWTDASGSFSSHFSVAGFGVHGSTATFAFSTPSGTPSTKPVATGSKLDVRGQRLLIEFDAGAPTSVESFAVSYDFVPEPVMTNRVRELDLTAANGYFDQLRQAVGNQWRRATSVTPHDTNYIGSDDAGLPLEYAIWVGGSGNVAVTTAAGDDVTFMAVPAGTLLPARVVRVKSTSTTATSLVALNG